MKVFEMLDVKTVEKFDEDIASAYFITVVIAAAGQMDERMLKSTATRLGMKILEGMSGELQDSSNKHPFVIECKKRMLDPEHLIKHMEKLL